MLQMRSRWKLGAAALAAAALAAPLGAQVRDGVEAWSRGDYVTAIAEWRGPAAAGDPDAMFNMAQAYRLGRGVPPDLAQAEALYFRAAQAGHVRAADTYGLMLFQDGRREVALPYVEAAARRGDPRAQYLLGVSHFNGDLVTRDWERAYALLTLANASGLPQAASAIAQMDTHIPLDQRQRAAGLAQQLEAEADQARIVELAAADLATEGGTALPTPAPRVAPAPSQRVPQPISTAAVPPSVASSRNSVQRAEQAAGTGSPAEAGASFASATATGSRPPVANPRPAPAPTTTPAPAPMPAPTATARASEPAVRPATPASGSTGPWRVQLGAFGVPGNAERLWQRVSVRPEVAGRERLFLPTGRVTRVQAAGYATQAEAQTACNSLKRAGFECLVTRN